MRDIAPADRSIRNIPVHHRHPRPPHEEPERLPRRRSGRGRFWLITLAVVVAAGAGGLLLSILFAGATVSVVPRTATVALPASVPAALNAPAGTLSYTTFTVSQSATTTMPASGTEQVEKQASGVITIRNSYSSASQRLIANTRFEAPDGKLYRIHDSVVVPGISGGTPGSVSITAYADSPGPDYNRSGNTSYTIPGFKGDPRYAKITASSGPMQGGFVGAEPAVAAADLSKAKTALEQQLSSSLQNAITAGIPAGYVALSGTTHVSYSDLTQSVASGSTATLSEGATATGALVRVADVAAAVARATIPSYAGEAITFENPEDVTLAATSTPSAVPNTLTIVLSGASPLVWIFDPNALRSALVGQPKSSFQDIIKSFQPAITQADLSLRPFWASSLPSDPNRITVASKKAE